MALYGPSRERRIRGTSIDTSRCSRMRTIAARSVSAAIIFMRPLHPGHSSTSTAHTRHISRAQSIRPFGIGIGPAPPRAPGPIAVTAAVL